MSFLKEIPAKHQATVSAVLQHLPLETKLEMLRTMKLEENVISKAADHLRPDFRLLLTESRRQVVNLLLKQEDWTVLKRVIRGESTEIQAAYTAFLEKIAAVSLCKSVLDPSEPAERSPSSSNRPKEAQNSGQKNQGNKAKAEKKSRFFDGFPKETNILLLGMDGSGKAEFINSFANYLKYENFDKALKNGPEVMIPTDSFTLVQDLNSAEMTYIPAEAEQTQLFRETQKAQVYSFMAEGAQKSLRFIDTPDFPPQGLIPRIFSRENKHLTNVLELVKNFGQIHAILIFERSDKEHTVSYRNYLSEAFRILHYQASKNIFFCFTSIANTSYRPGGSAFIEFADWPFDFKAGHEVRPSEKNTYCFENDSYRLLCAQKEGVPLSEYAISVGRKHWTLSVQETFRLLGHLKTLPPFSNSTLSTIYRLMPVLSDFLASRIVQIFVADEEIQKLEKGSIQQGGKKEADLRTLKERSDECKRALPKLVDFCVKLDTYFQQNVLVYDFFDGNFGYSLWEKATRVEVKLDPLTKTMFKRYFERERKHYAKKKKTYMNNIQKTGSQITLEEITARELPAIEPYFIKESKEWKCILTEQHILSRPHSARLITIEKDWYCNSHIWK